VRHPSLSGVFWRSSASTSGPRPCRRRYPRTSLHESHACKGETSLGQSAYVDRRPWESPTVERPRWAESGMAVLSDRNVEADIRFCSASRRLTTRLDIRRQRSDLRSTSSGHRRLRPRTSQVRRIADNSLSSSTGQDRPQLAHERRSHLSASPALRRPSSKTGKGFVRATDLTVSSGLRRRASAKAVFASSALPASA
jgi:hypothetical protein